MKKNLMHEDTETILNYYSKKILESPLLKEEMEYIQHGDTSVYDHSVDVAIMCLKIAHYFNVEVSEEELIRGALLHDYFLYDWHDQDESHKWHGFKHAKIALANAERDFNLTEIEKDMICCHMFPLNIRIPKYKESKILCLADKLCATKETTLYQVSKFKTLAKYISM